MAKKGSKFNKYTYEFKVMVVEDYLSGKSGGIDTITKKYNLKSSYQVRDWLKKYKKDISLLAQETRGRTSNGSPRSIKLDDMSIEEQNRYLKMENDILKKVESSPEKIRRAVKYKVIDSFKNKYSISCLCEYFKISRAAYYKWLKNNRPMYRQFDEALAKLIKDIFDETLKGYRFITFQLKRLHNIIVNRKTVLRYMNILNIKSPIRKKRFQSCTQKETSEKARIVHYNVLARNFKATRPYHKLVTDVTYTYHKNGRLFLSVIKDLYDNSIVAYTISKFNNNELVFRNIDLVFDDTWSQSNVCILHSDQGYQYTNLQYVKKLDNLGITISHSRKANCYDNACCENFFSHLKSESLELNIPGNENELIDRIDEYIKWYNYDRPQEKLKGMTPIEYRNSYLYS